MRRFLFAYYLKRALWSGYAWTCLVGCCFLGCGWLMEHNGVREFQFADKHGRPQGGSPAMLYWLGGSLIAGAAGRAVLVRMEAVKAYRARNGDALLPNE